MNDAPAMAFGPFDVLSVLGRGGSATVYKVRHRVSGKLAALKAALDRARLEPELLRRSSAPYSAIRPLRHANLVRAGARRSSQASFLLLEYVPGRNLSEHVQEHGPLPPERRRRFSALAQGLHHLHANHLVHRDIKPRSIFLTPDHQAKLGDFGLLKQCRGGDPLTASRQSMGTIDYGAPEQFEDAKEVDQRCDIYSFAATLYAALTGGKFPFGVGGRMQILQRKFFNEFVPLRLLLPDLDPNLDELVCRSLRANPDERPDSCIEILNVLRNYKPGVPMMADEATPTPNPAPDAWPRRERRASVRFAVDLTATFVPFHQNLRGRLDAAILDVSRLGLRLETSRPVAVHSVLEVRLPRAARSELALVRWVKQGRNDTQLVGCSFVRPLAEEAVAALQAGERDSA
ncbi:MAG: serine/threonine-protein kinase [Gemmataceae bacterium]